VVGLEEIVSLFETEFQELLVKEGGKSNRKNDRGKKTNMGITQKHWDEFRAKWPQNDLPADVFNVTVDQARLFYKLEYWYALSCGAIEFEPLVKALFITGVNQGAGTAAMRLQGLVGAKQDGVIGSKTLALIAPQDQKALVNAFCDATQADYNRILAADPTQIENKNGWHNRIDALRIA
jgi:lysozyme family protein